MNFTSTAHTRVVEFQYPTTNSNFINKIKSHTKRHGKLQFMGEGNKRDHWLLHDIRVSCSLSNMFFFKFFSLALDFKNEKKNEVKGQEKV